MSSHRLEVQKKPISKRTKITAATAFAAVVLLGGGAFAVAADNSSPQAACTTPTQNTDGSFTTDCTITVPQATSTATTTATTTETTTAPGSTTTITAPGSTSTVTQTVTGSPSSSSASPTTSTSTTTPPPVDTGIASAADTGYTHASCPNGRTTFTGSIKSNTTYSCMNFPGGVYVGSASSAVTGVTFYGDDFTGSGDSTALITLFGTNIAINYSTLSGSYQYGIEADGAYYAHVSGLTVSHVDISGFANAIDTNGSNQTFDYVYIHNPRNNSADHTDGIGSLGGAGAGSNIAITHSYINANANTNGIAFQGGTWSHMTVTDNQLGGFGYTVHIGDHTSFIDFERNTYLGGAQYGPVYPVNFWSSTGSVWANNKLANGTVWNHP